MTEWVCRWKPCWILTGDTFQKAYLEVWQRVKDGQNYDPIGDATQSIPFATDSTKIRGSENNDGTFKREQHWDNSSSPESSWQAVGEPDEPTWKLLGTQGTSAFWETSGAPFLPKKRLCNYVHPKQHGHLPDRLSLPYRDEEILSGYEKDVSFI